MSKTVHRPSYTRSLPIFFWHQIGNGSRWRPIFKKSNKSFIIYGIIMIEQGELLYQEKKLIEELDGIIYKIIVLNKILDGRKTRESHLIHYFKNPDTNTDFRKVMWERDELGYSLLTTLTVGLTSYSVRQTKRTMAAKQEVRLLQKTLLFDLIFDKLQSREHY